MNVKKILALLLAAMMVFGMTSAMAADDNNGEKTVTSGNTIIIPKGIVVTNPVAAQRVYTPNVTYHYTAAGVATPYTITDNTGVSVQTKKGVEGGLTIPDVEFTSALTAEGGVGANGYEIAKPITITVNPAVFKATGAGVYRYTITESVATGTGTDAEKLTAIGMTRVADYDTARILDIYLQNDTSAGAADGDLKLAGYVIAQSTTTNITAGTEDTNIEGKNGGFVPGEEGTVTTEVTDHKLNAPVSDEKSVDWYHTYNVTLEKEVTGTAGDKTKEFGFAEVVNNNGYQFLVKENSTDNTADTTKTSGADVAVTLKHGDKLYINGLNAKATVAYTETNNAPEEYKVTVTGSDSNNLAISIDGAAASNAADQALQANKTAALAATAITDYSSSATAKASITDANHVQAVKYTNKLDQISPTGVVLRFAPFLAMFAAGCVLFLILATKRSKKEEE